MPPRPLTLEVPGWEVAGRCEGVHLGLLGAWDPVAQRFWHRKLSGSVE